MKNTKITAALLAVTALCLNGGCSDKSSGNTEYEKPQTTVTVAADAVGETADAEAETTTEAAAETEEWAYSLTASNDSQLDISKLDSFEISSDDLHDGVWDSDITNTKNGTNRSPQLSWEPVEGASCYGVYMVDTGTAGFGSLIHWKSLAEETSLPAGWAPADEYVGPFPPEGTYVYEILVFAFREAPEKLKGSFGNPNPKLLEAFKAMDGENGGNIIACGHIKGTYTYGD